MPSTVRYRVLNTDPIEVGHTVRVAVEWVGVPETVTNWLGRTGVLGFAAWGISIGWDAGVLRLLNRDRRSAAPHMSQFFPRVGSLYRINQRDDDGTMQNDGDAQLICFGQLQRGGSLGDPELAPTPAGTLLTTLVFEALQPGSCGLRWLEQPGESASLIDNCVIYGNDQPNHKLDVEWADGSVTVHAGEPVEPPEPSPFATLYTVVEDMLRWAESNETPPGFLEFVMQLLAAIDSTAAALETTDGD